MVKRILFISIMIVVAAYADASLAQSELERDPFFSARPGSAPTTTSSPNDSWGRDPFARPFEEKAAVPQVQEPQVQRKKLTGIVYGDNARLAIIEGDMHKEGSMVGDQKLVEIRRRSVVFLNSAGGKEEVFLENFSIRK